MSAPGAPGEPLYQDVVTALAEEVAAGRDGLPGGMPRVLGGRYGLSSKEFTPAMAKAALDALDDPGAPQHCTIGIVEHFDLRDLVRGAEPVEEVHERNT